MQADQTIAAAIQASITAKQRMMQQPELLRTLEQVSQCMADAFGSGKRVWFCGNGGSAADAQHLAAELSGPFYNRNRPALAAEALHCNTSYLTAVANDYDYQTVYRRFVEGICQPGDVLIGMSTSGNSGNVVAAMEAARQKGVITVGLTGEGGGQMKPLSDYLLNVPSTHTPRIQECHMLLGHTLCELVEGRLFPPQNPA